MDDSIGTDAKAKKLVTAALEGSLTDKQAEQLAAFEPRLLKVVLLAAAKRITELESKLKGQGRVDPSTPSGQKPIYTKLPAPKRKGKPAASEKNIGRSVT